MNRLDRITAILIQLQSKKIVKAQEIADRFDISLRTVYRDVASLEEAGVPIIGEAGVGYSIMDGYRLPPVMFTKEEATAFLTAEKLVDKQTDKATAEQYKAAMYKVKAVLRSSEKGLLEDIDNAIHVLKNNTTNPPAGAANHIFDILYSISEKKALFIKYYTNHSEQMTEREIEPVGIYYVHNYWHLVAWCRMRNSYRDFRLDRIKKLNRTDSSFTVQNPTLTEYLHQLSAQHQMLEVTVAFDKSIVRYIQEQKLYYGFVSEEKKADKTEMTFLIGYPEYLAGWLLTFKDKATIIQPASFKKTLVDMIKTLSKHHS